VEIVPAVAIIYAVAVAGVAIFPNLSAGQRCIFASFDKIDGAIVT
jgi:hypothetical protein